jgi:hypothetical protein
LMCTMPCLSPPRSIRTPPPAGWPRGTALCGSAHPRSCHIPIAPPTRITNKRAPPPLHPPTISRPPNHPPTH